MPKYLIQLSYTAEGAKGVLKEGGSHRRAVVEETLQALNAKVEAFYFAMGEYDVYVIVDAPDNTTMAAVSMAVNATGAGSFRTTVLLTPEEIDAATKKAVDYRAPGR